MAPDTVSLSRFGAEPSYMDFWAFVIDPHVISAAVRAIWKLNVIDVLICTLEVCTSPSVVEGFTNSAFVVRLTASFKVTCGTVARVRRVLYRHGVFASFAAFTLAFGDLAVFPVNERFAQGRFFLPSRGVDDLLHRC